LTGPGEKMLEKLSAVHQEQLKRISTELSLLLEQLNRSE
jgi:hypothetical protein